MPIPLAALGLGLSAAGTGLGIFGANRSSDAMDDYMRRQLREQRSYQEEADELYRNSLAQSTPTAAQGTIGAGADQAMALYNRLGSVPLSSSTSKATPNQGQVNQNTSAYNQLIGAPNAQLQGITNYDIERWINNLKSNTQLNAVSSQAQQSASALPFKLQDAQSSGAAFSGLGSLLSAGGGLLGTYGAGRDAYNSGYMDMHNLYGRSPDQFTGFVPGGY